MCLLVAHGVLLFNNGGLNAPLATQRAAVLCGLRWHVMPQQAIHSDIAAMSSLARKAERCVCACKVCVGAALALHALACCCAQAACREQRLVSRNGKALWSGRRSLHVQCTITGCNLLTVLTSAFNIKLAFQWGLWLSAVALGGCTKCISLRLCCDSL